MSLDDFVLYSFFFWKIYFLFIFLFFFISKNSLGTNVFRYVDKFYHAKVRAFGVLVPRIVFIILDR